MASNVSRKNSLQLAKRLSLYRIAPCAMCRLCDAIAPTCNWHGVEDLEEYFLTSPSPRDSSFTRSDVESLLSQILEEQKAKRPKEPKKSAPKPEQTRLVIYKPGTSRLHHFRTPRCEIWEDLGPDVCTPPATGRC